MAAVTTIERRVTDENTVPTNTLSSLRPSHISRSPHPYHRRGSSLVDRDYIASSQATENSIDRPTKVSPRSSSDSGSEADTEGPALLKGLPAPPSKPRKGLRLSQKDGVESPLVTPSLLDDGDRKLCLEASRKISSPAKPAGLAAETRNRREKYTRRKQAELIRRLSETALLLVLGTIVFTGVGVAGVIRGWQLELFSFLALTLGLYVIYPIRVLHNTAAPGREAHLELPASFDPAPLLYPIFMPLMVAISLTTRTTNFILPNLILGLSSLPAPLIPFQSVSPGSSSVHWTIAALPLIVSQNAPTQLRPTKPLALKSRSDDLIDPDILILLYPLHQMLLPTLEYLTSTSLLPAELHLLSTALINLFLFAQSPQSEILKALLWVGGIGMFITCEHVLRWEVALARVPSWRFRRPTNPRRSGMSMFITIETYICHALSRLSRRVERDDSSDSDAPDRLTHGSGCNGKARGLEMETSRERNERLENGVLAPVIGGIGRATGAEVDRPGSTTVSHKRRHTFTTFEEAFKPPARTKTTPSGRPKRSITPNAQSYLCLTAAQAHLRKWLYACWAYIAAFLVVLGPIRRYVCLHALQGQEPVGWALSYLLGDSSFFRTCVSQLGLDQWVKLPPNNETSTAACRLGLVEHLRHDTFGEANTRLLLCAYCALVLAVGMAVVLELSTVVEVDTRRKVFHGMMVAMFLPTVFVDPAFTALALSLILAIFLLLDLFRASQLPPISRPLTHFLAPYVDGRDHRGPVIVSHVFLLIGCAIPLWMSLAGAGRTGQPPWEGWNVEGRDLSMVSGVICVGMGDAAASLIGRRFGRHKWPWAGGKSLEGSLAFAAVVTAGLLAAHTWRSVGGWAGPEKTHWIPVCSRAVVAATGASLTESLLTGANDNVVVPMMLWLLVRGLGI